MRLWVAVVLLLIGVAHSGAAAMGHGCCTSETPGTELPVAPVLIPDAAETATEALGSGLATCGTEACTCASCFCCFSAGQAQNVPADHRVQERWQPVLRLIAILVAATPEIRPDTDPVSLPVARESIRWTGEERLARYGQRLL
jgi:hypothetical protein